MLPVAWSGYVNRRGLDLSKEVLWISVGQRAAKLQAVKFGGLNNKSADLSTTHKTRGPGSNPGRWDYPESLRDCNLAAL